jgi:hypothetical protein
LEEDALIINSMNKEMEGRWAELACVNEVSRLGQIYEVTTRR